ncbi:CoA transferase [Marinomonas posidonica]|uniref:L-carnitine dehydratase/bile acid-inducible protein F n=1 Tax=Marinomonas posidonica (strain CECT 7376 / NCIMB 14433 / IVIA-Po-181) TaxID=491952 RepID=F6CXP4_MARPP|nr:CoA transferase [Marinomonas posidonica]AEF53357.1 L-carnitine dehydratase/bile acid-inducible protein F [Marinomonas posidonica IVIA-Po-181]
MNKHNQLPLTGVRVADFGQQIAGPAVAMVLADLGATVVHIDPPTGPSWQHPANAILNRNKASLRLDLKSQSGLEQALEIIANADIVIESFRPDVMKNLGIDFAELRQQRPELITLSMPGFASNDQLRRDWKATEAVVAATSGAFTDMGFNRVLMGVNPSYSPLPLGSAYAITLAASSIALALFEREKTGRGDTIEVPVAAALMEGLSYNSYVVDQLPERYKTMRELEIEHRKLNNIEMDLDYEQLQEYLDPFYRTYLCADGRMFYCVCPSHRNHAKRALQVLGIYDELIAEGLPDVKDLHAPIREWEGETSIGVYPLPKKWADIISAKMKRAFLQKTSEEWGVIFGEGQIPGAPHRTTQEWVNCEYTKESGLIVEVDDAEFGTMKQPGPIVWFEGEADAMLSPKAREDVSFDEAVSRLKEAEQMDQSSRPHGTDIQAASGDGWLSGIRILDLTNVIAGPHSSAFLSRFGADIIKLDPVTPLYDPLIGILFTFQAGVGKKSVLMDIMTPEGREIFEQLVKSVDMVVMNAPERQMVPLGLDQATLSAINPEVLFCRLDCFGAPRKGRKTNYIGYDDIIQANSGIMSRFGRPETPEEHAHLGTLDVNCGFAAGLGMALALYQKRKTGKVSRVRTSLSAVTNIAQLPFAFDYEGRESFDEPSGREVLGSHALSHFYQTQNGWLFLDAKPEELDKINQIAELEGIQASENIECFLSDAFVTQETEFWLEAFRQVDVACAEPLSIEYLRDNNSRPADQTVGIDRGSYAFSVYADHPSGHCVTQIDQYAIRPAESTIKAATPTEKFGHSTKIVLADLGFSDEDIDKMLAKRIVATKWSNEFLPS